MSLAADLNVLLLSEITLGGKPRLDTKLRMKVSAVISVTKSRCTALVAQHVYRHSQTFDASAVSDVFTKRGSAKSTPVTWNGLDC